MPSLTKYTRITLKHGLQKFMDFLAATPRYALYKNNLKMTQLTVDMVAAYVEYLKENGTGDGPKIYFRMFKRMVTAAGLEIFPIWHEYSFAARLHWQATPTYPLGIGTP